MENFFVASAPLWLLLIVCAWILHRRQHVPPSPRPPLPGEQHVTVITDAADQKDAEGFAARLVAQGIPAMPRVVEGEMRYSRRFVPVGRVLLWSVVVPNEDAERAREVLGVPDPADGPLTWIEGDDADGVDEEGDADGDADADDDGDDDPVTAGDRIFRTLGGVLVGAVLLLIVIGILRRL